MTENVLGSIYGDEGRRGGVGLDQRRKLASVVETGKRTPLR